MKKVVNEGGGRLASLRTSRRWTEERRGEVLAEEAPKKGGVSSWSWSRRSWLCGRRDVEAEDMAKEGGGEAGWGGKKERGGRRQAGLNQ